MVLHEEELRRVLSRMGNDIVSLVGLTRNMGIDYAELVNALGTGGAVFEETTGLQDRVILEHRDKDGNLIAKRDSGWSKNGITNAGMAATAGLITLDVGGTAFDYIAIGASTLAFAATQTALGSETHRGAGTGTRATTNVTDDTMQLVRTFSGYSGTESIYESGVFNAAASGTLLERQTFSVLNLNWTAGDTLQVTWKTVVQQA